MTETKYVTFEFSGVPFDRTQFGVSEPSSVSYGARER